MDCLSRASEMVAGASSLSLSKEELAGLVQ
jgi:hypothetical protein